MKKIEAIIRPRTVYAIHEALQAIGITGMTIIAVHGCGRQKGYVEIYRGEEYLVQFLKRTKIEIIVEDDMVQACIDIISEHGRTGKIGDGKIIISTLEEVIRIRTGETGSAAM